MFRPDVKIPEHITELFKTLTKVLNQEQYSQLYNYVSSTARQLVMYENIKKKQYVDMPALKAQVESLEGQVRNLDRDNTALRRRIAELESLTSVSAE